MTAGADNLSGPPDSRIALDGPRQATARGTAVAVSRGMRPCAVILAALVATACGASDPAEPGPDAGPSDGPTAVDATATDAPQPIVAPANTWTYVPIDGARCAQGGETGIIVRLRPDSRDLLLYFEGGGACSDAETCWLDPTAANVAGYGPVEAAAESKLRSYALFDPDAASGNPFATMNMVMIPYCTGDAHAGDAVVDLMVDNVPRATHFVGANNARLALARLGVTLPDLDRVFVAGTSAGGGGATFHYGRVRDTFATTVHTVIDSTPGFPSPGDAGKWALWGVVLPCPTCTTVPAVRAYNRSLDPTSRYGFLSFAFDPTTADGRSVEEFTALLDELRATLATDPNARSYVADNLDYDCREVSCHVITTKNRADLRASYLAWLRAMVSGTGWVDTTFRP